MKNSALAVYLHIRNVALCGLAAFALSACGGGSDGSSSSAAASTPSTSLVSPTAGLIDRSGSVAANTGATSDSAISTPVSAAASGTTTVASNGSGTATLDWTPPTQNSDGSVLTDLASYTVYYGTSPGSLNQKVKITNPGLSAYTMTDLAPGTWYFAVSSTSAAGSESALSAVVSTRI